MYYTILECVLNGLSNDIHIIQIQNLVDQDWSINIKGIYGLWSLLIKGNYEYWKYSSWLG